MNEHIGKLCPHCNNPIQENDTTVVCPDCGVVYHGVCWQANQGCKTVGCPSNHQVASAPVAPTAPVAPAPAFCNVCGTPLTEGQMFCANCGNKVNAAPVAPAPIVPPVAAPNPNPNAAYGGAYNYGAPVNPAISQFNASVQQQNEKKKKKTPLIIGIIAAIVVLIIIISSAGPKVDSIVLSDTSVELLVDDTYSITYTISPASSSDADVTWTSSNSSVARVSSSGKITAVGEGTCVITAKAGKKTDTVSVTVSALRPEESMLIGTWSVVGFLQDGDITTLASSASTAYMYNDLSGKMVTGDTTLTFTWTYKKYDDGNYYYTAITGDGSTMNFVYMSEYKYLVFNLGSMQVIYE